MTDIIITRGEHHTKVEANTKAGALFIQGQAASDAAVSYHIDPTAGPHHVAKAKALGLTVEVRR